MKAQKAKMQGNGSPKRPKRKEMKAQEAKRMPPPGRRIRPGYTLQGPKCQNESPKGQNGSPKAKIKAKKSKMQGNGSPKRPKLKQRLKGYHPLTKDTPRIHQDTPRIPPLNFTTVRIEDLGFGVIAF